MTSTMETIIQTTGPQWKIFQYYVMSFIVLVLLYGTGHGDRSLCTMAIAIEDSEVVAELSP